MTIFLKKIKFTFIILSTLLIFTSISTHVLAQSKSKSESSVVYLDQGWDEVRRDQFYYTPQGSRLFPYSWFLALEQSTSEKLFSDPENLKKFGWIASGAALTKLNPDGLPIGFAIDPDNQPGTGKWVGLTCAACHTNNVIANGKTLRIDGAPAMADFGQFLIAMSHVVTVNHPAVDKEKFARFAARVLGKNATPETIKQLAGLYTTIAIPFNGRAWMRTPPLQAGPGRVDALTQIINSLAVFNLTQPDNLHPPIAPVSYPFLWLTPKLEWVQWNPIASNPISRNVGEVLGVFGHADFNPKVNGQQNPELFSSSALLKNVYELEQWVDELKPPKWNEEVFGKIDPKRWSQGAGLFKKDCLACHNMPMGPDKKFIMSNPADNAFQKQFIKIKPVDYKTVGTDPMYIQSLISRFVETDQLSEFFDNKPITPAATYFLTTVGAVVKRSFADNQLDKQQQIEYSGYRFRPVGYRNCGGEPAAKVESYAPCSVTDLKAGPLLGIWATGPFLHNGSVPTIYQLLSPPEAREKTFWVGSTRLDTTDLGFSRDDSGYGRAIDTRLPGNGNKGHVYPKNGYSHEERLQVIEYLKDPERF